MATHLEPLSGSRQLSEVLREIAALAASDISEESFFAQWLACSVSVTAARSAALWLLSDEGLLSQALRHPGADSGLDRSEADQRLHAQQLLNVIHARETVIRPALTIPRTDKPSGYQVFVPLLKNDGCAGVVELQSDNETPGDDGSETAAFLEEAAALAVRFLRWKREAASHTRQVAFWREFQPFSLALQQSLDVETIAGIVVNDARLLIGCDRLSVVLEHGPQFRLAAVSGQEHVDRRSHLARAICRLGELAAQSRQEILYTGDVDHLPESLAQPLLDFSQATSARAVKVIPLTAPRADLSSQPSPKNPREADPSEAAPFGALIVEHFTDSWIDPLTSQKAELTASHAAAALANARVHSRIFLRPLWQELGKRREWFRGRRLRKLGLVLSSVCSITALLAIVPATYRVEATGLLMPVEQQRVFAPWDGEVVEVVVQSGRRVDPGDVLLRMRNQELDAELLAARHRLEELRQRAAALDAEIDRGPQRADDETTVRLRGRLAQTEIEVRGAAELVTALERQVNRLTVRAPAAGTVATFHVDQRLLHRPVRRGELLLELMNESGPWQLELEVPEDRAGHLLAAQSEQPATGLEFVLDTQPESTWAGTVSYVAPRADDSELYGTSVRVLAQLTEGDLPPLHIGAQARAKLNCGSRSLAYVLFGDLLEFVQLRVW